MKMFSIQRIVMTAIIALSLAFIGCGSSTNLLDDISGVYKSSQGEKPVAINLASDAKSLVIDGQNYPVTVEKINMDRYEVDLKVTGTGGKTETWTLRQIWDDTGSNFKLAFNRNGSEEELTVHKQS